MSTSNKKQKELKLKAIKWANSPQGIKDLKASYLKSKQKTDSLEKARRVDPESLIRPITK